MTTHSSFVVSPSSRTVLLSGPLGALLVLSSDATDGRFSLVEHPLQARTLGSPLHTHRNEDEFSLVLEGIVGAQIGPDVVTAGAGTLLIKPRGIPHAFWNPTDAPARLLEVISPGGFESYFADVAGLLGVPGPPDLAGLAALAARYGLDLDPESVPRLAADHGLEI